MAGWLEARWYRHSLWHVLLLPLSGLFWLLSALRRFAYRRGWFAATRLPVQIIVIGNITVGGTGKTPLVIWTVEMLQRAGFTPGVISRGYGGRAQEPVLAHSHSDPARVGDEPVLIAQRTQVPVCVGADRVRAARKLLDSHPECDVIVSDDGLQHYALHRNIEIIVVDGARRFGNGWLLPAGPLRESKSRLREADAVVVNTPVTEGHDGRGFPEGMPEKPHQMRLSGQVFWNLRDPEQRATVADFKGKTLHAIAGIGNPARFFAQLRHMGLEVVGHPYPDHHAYTPEDLRFPPGYQVLMTEKDAVKCRAFADASCWALAVSAEVEPGLAEQMLGKLKKAYGPKTA